jgi:uncharacterized membrane protein YjjP (DUF1212 family)
VSKFFHESFIDFLFAELTWNHINAEEVLFNFEELERISYLRYVKSFKFGVSTIVLSHVFGDEDSSYISSWVMILTS